MTSTLLARGRRDPTGAEPTTADLGTRHVRRSSRLPSGRAVAGGLLVTTSLIGLYAAHAATSAPPRTNWLIAVRPVPAGHVIVADDLALAPIRLASQTEAHGLNDPDDVIGHTTVISLDDGDLIQRGAISGSSSAATPPSSRRISIELDRAEALNGELAPGDEVDVLVTPSSSAAAGAPGASTRAIVRRALVQGVSASDDSAVGSRGKVLLTLVVGDETAAVAVVDAYSTGQIHLIASSPLEIPDDH